MSSANFYSGYNPEKPTSKVLAPPGGRSNNIFGTSEPVVAKATITAQEEAQNQANQKTFLQNHQDNLHNKRMNHTSNILFGDDSTPDNHTTHKAVNDRQKSSIFDDHSAVTNGNGVKQDKRGAQAYNPITGQAYVKDEGAPQKAVEPEPQVQAPVVPEPTQTGEPVKPPVHTSSRVLQPPGGRSTALW